MKKIRSYFRVSVRKRLTKEIDVTKKLDGNAINYVYKNKKN